MYTEKHFFTKGKLSFHSDEQDKVIPLLNAVVLGISREIYHGNLQTKHNLKI